MDVMTIGTFDLLHRGHIELFNICKIFAGEDGKVIVAVNTDEFVKRYKGKKPIINTIHRLDMIRSIKWVDEVCINIGDEDCKPVINKYEPRYLVVGSDWLSKDYLKQTGLTTNYLDEMQISVIFTPRFYDSTTIIKERIKNES